MKIFIVANGMLSIIAQDLGIDKREGPSWIEGLYHDIVESPDIDLAYCFPYVEGDHNISGQIGKLKYYGFHKTYRNATKYDSSVEYQIKQALDAFKPAILHIFGTEFPHTLAAVKAFNNTSKTVIHIQGLCSICAKHYYASLSNKVINRYSFRDLIRMDNIKRAKEKFEIRGKYEIEALKMTEHVIGRTDWDRACTLQINPRVNYHFCNETLRKKFYKQTWDIQKCEKYSIFVSQAGYPLKGFHYLLQALPEIIKRFPNTHVYVAGTNISKTDTLKNKCHITSYGIYLNELIKNNKLKKYITFTDLLGETDMCKRLLRSHIFVSASTIENASNSLSEAMILGVPSVASDVGGIKDIFTHKIDGYVYQHDAAYMLAYYICEIFEHDELAIKFSESSQQHAKLTHDINQNYQTLINIYRNIYKEVM